jgi:hypothetical protein
MRSLDSSRIPASVRGVKSGVSDVALPPEWCARVHIGLSLQHIASEKHVVTFDDTLDLALPFDR